LAIANEPKLLLADEPTGAVDNATATLILDLLRKINRELGLTVLIVTHDLKLSAKVDRVIKIRDGRTSTEYLKRDGMEEMNVNFDHNGAAATHREYVVVDRVGRLQIPQELLEEAGIRFMSRVRLEINDNGHLELLPFEEEQKGDC
ncbi:MAG: ABC transporter ATP-binding protein, partial [Clostridia bacterium]|nr:ABC transporter ATP-binding protein [Clostridia bacterium]